MLLRQALKKICARQEGILRDYEKHEAKLKQEAEARARALEAKKRLQEKREAERLQAEAKRLQAEAKAKAEEEAKNKGAIKKWKTRIAFITEARQKANDFCGKYKVPALKLRGAFLCLIIFV